MCNNIAREEQAYQNGFIAGANSIVRRKVITGITEDMLIRRIEKRFSRYKRSIPVGKLRIFLSELRERCYVAKN